MASEICTELSTATEYEWDNKLDRPTNIQALLKSTDKLEDPDYKKLSKDATNYIDSVFTAADAGKPVPEFPDYTADAPKRRRRQKAEESAPEKSEESAPAKAEEPAPRRRAAKTESPTADATKAADATAPVRGAKMFGFRKLVLENPTLSKAEVFKMSEDIGLGVTKSTAALVHYNTRHTLQVMKQLGMHDHVQAMADKAAAAK